MKPLTAPNRPSFRPDSCVPPLDRGDQVDIALAHRRAVFGKGHAPRGALAFGEVLGLAGIGETLALEERDHRIGRQRLHQVVAQAALVGPGQHLAGLLGRQRDDGARHQHRLAAQKVGEFGLGEVGALEVLGVGPGAHRGAGLAVAGAGRQHRLADHQRLDHVAARERQPGHLAFAVDGDFEPLRQRVRDANAHAVQAAGEAVGPTGALVELAAGMQPRKHDFDHGHLLFGVQAEGDAAAVVVHADRAIGVQHHVDALAVAGQGLVGRVVDHLLDDVQRVVGAGVHARPLLHGFEALENADR